MEKYDKGLGLIADAQAAEKRLSFTEAHSKYMEGIETLLKVSRNETNEETSRMVRGHIARFIDNAGAVADRKDLPTPSPAKQRAERKEEEARKLEQNLKFMVAKTTFTQAAELYYAYSAARCEETVNEAGKTWAGERANAMLDRAERLKKYLQGQQAAGAAPASGTSSSSTMDMLDALPSAPGAGESWSPDAAVVPAQAAKPELVTPGFLPNSLTAAFVRGPGRTSREEERVLILGNKINGRSYERMFSSDGDYSNFAGADFKDPDGHPKLSDKQKMAGAVWARPSQIMSTPTVITEFKFQTLTQTLVGDCSFVSSLAVCASWEQRFEKTLISRNIYPQRNGQAVVSPSGKYIVKMYLNGTVRKITVDDYLPVAKDTTGGKNPQFLCSYSSKADELWVSLFEKAYIKLHGGYDFPGSTSAIDLHALCGWIPETMSLKADSAEQTDPETAWTRMKAGQDKGTALFTMGTREMDDKEEERAGLASKHAYAVLDVREECGRRIVKLKNPWAHIRWKGAFSPDDETNWTPELMTALKYDTEAEKKDDDGVFWISWEAVLSFFSNIHASWSPSRFSSRKNVHGYWTKTGSDRKHLDDNPQYILRVTAKQKTMVWLLLDRHHVNTKEEPHVALHVYKGNRKQIHNSEALVHSVYRQNPHFLLRLPIPAGDSSFVLVVSTYDDKDTMPFSLTCYSACPTALLPALESPAIETIKGNWSKQFKYKWGTETAGGSINTEAFDVNPQFRLEVEGEEDNEEKPVRANGEGEPHVGIHLFAGGARCHRGHDSALKPVAGGDAYTNSVAWREFDVPA
ncbi:hypothetical protein T484DRAFT_1779925, partial [Baffinella frigidus]